MNIPVSCRTNMDGYEMVSWPTEMCVKPSKGDRVMSICGTRVLKVSDVTHAVSRASSAYLVVELTSGY